MIVALDWEVCLHSPSRDITAEKTSSS